MQSIIIFKYLLRFCLGDENPDEDEIFAVVSSLKKIAYFYNCHDMSRLNIWEGLYEVSFFSNEWAYNEKRMTTSISSEARRNQTSILIRGRENRVSP